LLLLIAQFLFPLRIWLVAVTNEPAQFSKPG
jgi:hypothetical protein